MPVSILPHRRKNRYCWRYFAFYVHKWIIYKVWMKTCSTTDIFSINTCYLFFLLDEISIYIFLCCNVTKQILQQLETSKDTLGNKTHKKSGTRRFCSTQCYRLFLNPMVNYTLQYYECELVYIVLSVIQFQRT